MGEKKNCKCEFRSLELKLNVLQRDGREEDDSGVWMSTARVER